MNFHFLCAHFHSIKLFDINLRSVLWRIINLRRLLSIRSRMRRMCQSALSITLWNDVGWLLFFFLLLIYLYNYFYTIKFVYIKRAYMWEEIASGKTELYKKFTKTQSETFCYGWEGGKKTERERQWGCKKKEIHPFFAWCVKASELTALHCLDLGFLHSPSKAL